MQVVCPGTFVFIPIGCRLAAHTKCRGGGGGGETIFGVGGKLTFNRLLLEEVVRYDFDLVRRQGGRSNRLGEVLEHERSRRKMRVFLEHAQEINPVVPANIHDECVAVAQVSTLKQRPGVVEVGPWPLLPGPQRHEAREALLVSRVRLAPSPEVLLLRVCIDVATVIVIQRLAVVRLGQELGKVLGALRDVVGSTARKSGN